MINFLMVSPRCPTLPDFGVPLKGLISGSHLGIHNLKYKEPNSILKVSGKQVKLFMRKSIIILGKYNTGR